MGLKDYENMIGMLTRRGIQFKSAEGIKQIDGPIEQPTGGLFRLPRQTYVDVPVLTITIYGGYSGFFTVMSFNKKSEDLISIEAYE